MQKGMTTYCQHSLFVHFKHAIILIRFYNNAINTSGQQFGLFLTIAMVNHSCVPNAGEALAD